MSARREAREVATFARGEGLPANIARGPRSPTLPLSESLPAWREAGTEWSQRHLGNEDGWYALLMPAELAAGPKNEAGLTAWNIAGTAWSRENLGNINGWLILLPPKVREATSTRARIKVIGDGILPKRRRTET